MFGGTTIAQLLAAARWSTLGPTHASSVSVHFIAPADSSTPCDYHVEQVHDGKSSATRRVTAIQGGETVAIGTVAFHTPRPTWAHGQREEPAVHPDSLPPTGMPHPARAIPEGTFDIRYQDDRHNGAFLRRLWFRAVDTLPEDVTVHECVISLISDLYFFEPVVAEHGLQANDRTVGYGTTQHTMWFHNAARADEWLLIESTSPVGAGGRGLVSGQIRTASRLVVATLVQEIAIRMATNPIETNAASRAPEKAQQS